MKNTASYNTQNTGSKLNTTTALVLLIAALPILLFALTKMFPPTVDATKNTAISEAEAKRTSAAERRAQRAEERKAKKAEKAATATAQRGMAPDPGAFTAPMPPMEFNGFDGGFGPGFDNGMAMAPGGFGGGFGGPGMGGFGGGFGGPGFGGPF